MKRSHAAMLSMFLLTACSTAGGAQYAPGSAPMSLHGAVAPSSSSGPQLQTLDVPLSQFPTATDTLLTGIRGNIITAFFHQTSGGSIAVVYNRTNGVWTKIAFPGADSTAAYGPAMTSTSYRVVGSYSYSGSPNSHGFAYNASTNQYITLDVPAGFCGKKPCNFTIAHSNYGKNANYMVVGNFDAVSKGAPQPQFGDSYPISGHAFLYQPTKAGLVPFTNIDIPKATSTTAYGIWVDGKTVAVAGGYTQSKTIRAYVRDLNSSKMLVYTYPGATITHFEGITGAGGPGNYNVIGDAVSAKNKFETGFFMPIRNWKAGSPVVIGTVSANSVYQNTVIGVYAGAGLDNGYITNIP